MVELNLCAFGSFTYKKGGVGGAGGIHNTHTHCISSACPLEMEYMYWLYQWAEWKSWKHIFDLEIYVSL